MENSILKQTMEKLFFEMDHTRESITQNTQSIVQYLRDMLEARINLESDRKFRRYQEHITQSFRTIIGGTVNALSTAHEFAADATFGTEANPNDDDHPMPYSHNDTALPNHVSPTQLPSPGEQNPTDPFAAAFPMSPPPNRSPTLDSTNPNPTPPITNRQELMPQNTTTPSPPIANPRVTPAQLPDDADAFIGMKLPCTLVDKGRLTMRRVYEEFFGLGERQDIPTPQGFHGLDERFKSRWRSKHSSKDQTFYNRVQSICRGICVYHQVPPGHWSPVIEEFCLEWDAILHKKGIHGVFREFQKHGITTKRGTRSPSNKTNT